MRLCTWLIIALAYSTPSFSQGWFINNVFSPAQTIPAIKFYDANTGYCVSVLYNSSTFNIYKTTNAAANWTPQSSGYTATRFMCIWIQHPDTVYMSGNFGLIIKTTNGGQNWFTQPTGNTDQLWGICFVNSLTGYVCGSSGRIMKTTDAGENWFNQASGMQNAFSSIHFRNENTGYISGGSIMVKTTNGGLNWAPMSAPYISLENIREITFSDNLTGYAVSDIGRIFKTTDAGANWNLIPSGTTESLFGIFFTGHDTAYVCGYNGVIMRTSDAGANWTAQNSGVPEILNDIWFTSPMVGYISCWNSKILKTTNGGITFVQQIGNEIPGDFSLSQNYPNPFNPVTTINYEIRIKSLIRLSVFDLNGRLISELINQKQGPGTYSIEFDGKGLSSGVYFYKLRAGDYSETRKMILAK